jgi:predicted amidohydrolase YtcJ
MMVANSLALAAARVERDTPDPIGGRIDRASDGTPSGLLLESAQQHVEAAVPAPTVVEMRDALGTASKRMAREGVTSLQDADAGTVSPLELDGWQAAHDSGALGQRVRLIVNVDRVYPHDRGENRDLRGPRVLGSRLRVDGLKIFADGSLIGRTAAVQNPYEEEPENTGMLRYDSEELRRIVRTAHSDGWQISIHAIGDRAIAEALDSYEDALSERPKPDHRHRIEHCGILSLELIERIQRLGVVPVTQPRFISELGDGFARALGRSRLQLCYPLATLLRRGINLAGSSDRPVVEGAPLLGIHDCVNQRTGSGAPYAPEEALSPLEALALFTRNAAYAERQEVTKGTLALDKVGDFVVLEADPTAVGPEEIGAIPVLGTFVGGVPIYTEGL